MPRELTLQPVRQEAASSHLAIEIRHTDRAVRVTLSGILDHDGFKTLVATLGRHLSGRGHRVILDGRGLSHMDYRITGELTRWNRTMRQFGHQLLLQGWSDYLKAILCMGDWDGELLGSVGGVGCFGSLRGLRPGLMP